MPLLLDRRAWLALTAAAGLTGAFVARSPAATEVGRVAVLLGQAVRHAASGPMPLQPGGGVAAGDEVETLADSRLEIAFIDGSSLVLGPETRVQIAQFAPADGVAQALILLVAGVVKVAVGDAITWQTFQVETETAIASVRGTEWVMQQTPEGSAVLVLEGRVEVTPRQPPTPTVAPGPSQDEHKQEKSDPLDQKSGTGGPTILEPGEGTDVAPGAFPTLPKVWGDKRREAVLALVSLP